jgi:Domain of unknown function (DUF1735)
MKTIKSINYKILSVLALAVLSLSSCLKDSRYIDFAGSPPLLEFPLASYNSNETLLVGPSNTVRTTDFIPVVASAGTYNLPVTVNLASPAVLTVPVTFTVTVDQSVFTAPATSTTAPKQVIPAAETTPITTYFPLPAADYTITGASGTIPAGQRTAVVNVAINGTAIGNSIKNYALRLVISSGSVQLSNWNFITYNFQLQ